MNLASFTNLKAMHCTKLLELCMYILLEVVTFSSCIFFLCSFCGFSSASWSFLEFSCSRVIIFLPHASCPIVGPTPLCSNITNVPTKKCLQITIYSFLWNDHRTNLVNCFCYCLTFHAYILIASLADGDSLMCCIVMMERQIAKMFSTFSL